MTRRMNFRQGFVTHTYRTVPYRTSRPMRVRGGRRQHRIGYYNPSLMQAAGMGISNAVFQRGIRRATRRLPSHVNRIIDEYLGF